MAQQLAQETQGFQRTLELSGKQLEMSAERSGRGCAWPGMSGPRLARRKGAQRFPKAGRDEAELHRLGARPQEKVALGADAGGPAAAERPGCRRLRRPLRTRREGQAPKEAELLQLKSEEVSCGGGPGPGVGSALGGCAVGPDCPLPT